jgi:glutamine cyclotransferase
MSAGYRLDTEAVLNGIAYDAANNRLFVTGKLWPRLFEIEVVPRK